MDFLLDHRNVALAFVYGPANNLLAKPQSLGGGGDLGTQKFTLPARRRPSSWASTKEQEYTLDEVWEVAKDLTFVVQNNITKEQLGQFLGAGPATRVADEDTAVLDHWADDYEERLEEAGLSKDRPAEQYKARRLHPVALLPVRRDGGRARRLGGSEAGEEGPRKAEADPADAPLTLERLKDDVRRRGDRPR